MIGYHYEDGTNKTRLPKVTSMNFCSAAKPISQRSRNSVLLSGKARGAVRKRQSGGPKGATELLAIASDKAMKLAITFNRRMK